VFCGGVEDVVYGEGGGIPLAEDVGTDRVGVGRGMAPEKEEFGRSIGVVAGDQVSDRSGSSGDDGWLGGGKNLGWVQLVGSSGGALGVFLG